MILAALSVHAGRLGHVVVAGGTVSNDRASTCWRRSAQNSGVGATTTRSPPGMLTSPPSQNSPVRHLRVRGLNHATGGTAFLDAAPHFDRIARLHAEAARLNLPGPAQLRRPMSSNRSTVTSIPSSGGASARTCRPSLNDARALGARSLSM